MTTRKPLAGAVSVAALVLAAPSVAQEQSGDSVQVINEWTYNEVYEQGWSVENMFDETEVVGLEGDEIGDVENIIFSNDGRIVSIIAEVGGFWDVGDTHVNVPWDQVETGSTIEALSVPVTEETVGEYDVFGGWDWQWNESAVLSEQDAQETTEVDDDLVAGGSIFRATDLIGDYVYLDGDVRYGYVNDILVQDGQIAAIVVDAASFGRPGYYAYPYAGNNVAPANTAAYPMPYTAEEVTQIESFDYEQLQSPAVR